MKTANDICSLEYLIGTLSTAYKGVITSLAAKDFCMTEAGGSITLKGRVLSIPAGGEYEASLIRSGTELARTKLEKGYFELRAGGDEVQQAKDLQIDIIQGGRHVGTFLLKKESSDGFYISAVELSEELKGVDLKSLTAPLHDKVGLLHKAEEIITKILSTKKDWPVFSELLNGFASDLFWSTREAFYGSFSILVRFSLKAAERTDSTVTTKPISNFLDCIGLPLEHETDAQALRAPVEFWLTELKGSSVDLTGRLRATSQTLSVIHEKFPDADLAPVLTDLLSSIRKKLIAMPSLSAETLRQFKEHVTSNEYASLARYGDASREELFEELAEAGRELGQGALGKVLVFLKALDADILDDGKMVTEVYEAVAGNITADSACELTTALTGIFSLFPRMSGRALDAVLSNAPLVMAKLVSFGRTDAGARLLAAVAHAGPLVADKIVMDPGIAAAILRSGNEELIAQYAGILERTVIPTARVRTLSTETWAELVDPLHLERLAKFMDILQLGGERLRSVLVHVIANLSVSGVFIPDDRLFQRNVSSYLNSEAMRGDFLLNFLLLQKLPVYYNEVGAVSAIRDLSTELDSWGNDPVLYFARKQVHVNASNYNVRLLEKIITSWVQDDPALIREVIPADVYASVKPGLIKQYAAFIRPFFGSIGVLDAEGLHFDRLPAVPIEKFKGPLQDGNPEEIPSKVMLLCRLYREIVRKYSLVSAGTFQGDVYKALREQLDKEGDLVRVVLDPGKTAAQESLYFKRHIAFGIPSVLGTYHEPKLDALADLLRHDAMISVFMEEIIRGIVVDKNKFTATAALSRLRALKLSYEVLRLHGLENEHLEELAAIMDKNKLHLSQIVDLLKMWQKELAWMVEFINRTFHKAVADILSQFRKEDLPEYLMNLDVLDPDFANKAADIVIRNLISSVPGLVEADRMIERLINALFARMEKSDEELNELQSVEDRQYFLLHELSGTDAARLGPVLGSKAGNLVSLLNRGFHVPPGVVFSAAMTKHYKTYVESTDFAAALGQAIKHLEEKTGTQFGGAKTPLFLSVRSGSYVSMPGILSTILFCGMNKDTLAGFIQETGDPRLGWDSYRRFIEQYATVVLGLDTGILESITAEVLKQCGLEKREECEAGHVEQIVKRELAFLTRRGLSIPDDVYEQLKQSIRAIYASWSGERAQQFRKATRTSEHWGTAVTLMQMVLGNAAGSGASTFFTRNPFTFAQELYGETKELATGDDLVYGRYQGRPLSKDQVRNREESLEEKDPVLFKAHQELAKKIEQAMGGLPQEVEVAYMREPDGSRGIFVLQTRRMEAGAGYVSSFDEICNMEPKIIGRGVGAHGGAVSGVASFARTPDQAQRLAKESNMPVVLLRPMASTDDVSLMPVIRGIITSSGGVTSHAAVLAQKFGVSAVVSCAELSIETGEQGARFARMGEVIIKEGMPISIDGTTGLVFSGTCLHTTRSERY
jgi:pyruvate, orthophosphate dikinase